MNTKNNSNKQKRNINIIQTWKTVTLYIRISHRITILRKNQINSIIIQVMLIWINSYKEVLFIRTFRIQVEISFRILEVISFKIQVVIIFKTQTITLFKILMNKTNIKLIKHSPTIDNNNSTNLLKLPIKINKCRNK